MSIKNDFTIEELEAQYKLVEESQKSLKQQIEQKKEEEKKAREVKLAAEKEARKKEVDDAIINCKTLIKTYMQDYGIYSFRSNSEDDNIFSSKFWNWII